MKLNCISYTCPIKDSCSTHKKQIHTDTDMHLDFSDKITATKNGYSCPYYVLKYETWVSDRTG